MLLDSITTIQGTITKKRHEKKLEQVENKKVKRKQAGAVTHA
jgi:hypothetical protein